MGPDLEQVVKSVGKNIRVVMIENILRRLGHGDPNRSFIDVIRSAGQEVSRPIFFGVLIIVLVYVPI